MLNVFGKRQKKNKLDKFYTDPAVARSMIEKTFDLFDEREFDVILEPSAGNGSFYQSLPADKRMGLDISPDHKEIIEQDYFKWEPSIEKRYLVIGNPPFGRVSSTAVRFFQKSAEFADVIAFLVPRTFRRFSIQNKLNRSFHLVYDEEIPVTPCCFTPKMTAKCCFQVWEKRDYLRGIVELPKESPDWQFLAMGPKDSNGQPTPPVGADFAVKAYGSNCGSIVEEDLQLLRPKSWHWIKTKNPEELKNRFSQIDYSISEDTARQNSLGRSELIYLYEKTFKKNIDTE